MKKVKKLNLPKMPIPLEEEEQQNFIAHCELNNIKVISTQNGVYLGGAGGRFNYIEKLKSLGLSKGFPDLIIFAKNSKTFIYFVEMKRTKNSVLSEDQKDWIKWLDEYGCYVSVAYGCEHAIELLDKYLSM